MSSERGPSEEVSSEEVSSDTVIAVGYGLLPANTGAANLYQVLTIAAEVEVGTHFIIDASVTVVTAVSQRWVRQLLLDRDLTSEQDTEDFASSMEKRFLGSTRRAIVHAYRDMTQRYAEHLGLLKP